MPKRRKKKQNIYWTKEFDHKIIKFHKETDPEKRDVLFKEIYPVLFKLVEAIFNRFKMTYIWSDENWMDTIEQCITYCFLQFKNYKIKQSGFSYFSIVARNWLIQLNQRTERYAKRHVDIHSLTFNNEAEKRDFPDQLKIYPPYSDSDGYVREQFIKNAEEKIKDIFRYDTVRQKVAISILKCVKHLEFESKYLCRHHFFKAIRYQYEKDYGKRSLNANTLIATINKMNESIYAPIFKKS